MQVGGRVRGAIEIFTACIVPSLLANCGTWVEVSDKTIRKLDGILNMFVKVLLRLPSSKPLPSYRVEMGMLGMKWRLWEEMLRLVTAIQQQEGEVLARDVLDVQVEMGARTGGRRERHM